MPIKDRREGRTTSMGLVAENAQLREQLASKDVRIKELEGRLAVEKSVNTDYLHCNKAYGEQLADAREQIKQSDLDRESERHKRIEAEKDKHDMAGMFARQTI